MSTVTRERAPQTTATSSRRRTPAMVVKRFGGYAVLIFFAVIYLYPFFIQIATSFKTDADAAQNPVSLRSPEVGVG